MSASFMVSLIPFDPSKHKQLLATWLCAPHITRWWGDPEAQLTACLARPNGGGDALITVSGDPVGYVRWQQTPRSELDAAGLVDLPDGVLDIDIAIGSPSHTGKGIGSSALRQVVAHVRGGTSRPIVIATSATNHRAIRAFQRAGFHYDRTFDDPEYGACVLLRYPETLGQSETSEEIDA